MILKVNRNSDHVRKPDDNINQWLYIDKIKSFSTKTFIPHSDYITFVGDQNNPKGAIYEYLELNYTHVILDPNRTKDIDWINDWVTEFIIHDEDGDKFIRMSIVFNTYAYLMNDQGQTIEKFTH